MKLDDEQISLAYSNIMKALSNLNKNQTNPIPYHDLEDIVQNTMLRIIKQKMDFEDIRVFQAWCFKAANFERLDYFRTKKRQNREPEYKPISDPTRSSKSGVSVPFKTPTEEPTGMILFEECWEKMTQKEQNLLSFRMGGLTADEISKEMKIALGTVLNIMAVARMKMYNCMGLD